MSTASAENPSYSTRRSVSYHTRTIPSNDTRIVQNFILVWLDSNIDEANPDCQNTILTLRRIVNIIYTFTDWSACYAHISEIINVKIFMVCIRCPWPTPMVPSTQLLSQIEAIYVFCANKEWHERWTKEWSKTKGVFTNICSLSKALTQAARQCDHDSISMSLISITMDTRQGGSYKLDPSFMYTQY